MISSRQVHSRGTRKYCRSVSWLQWHDTWSIFRALRWAQGKLRAEGIFCIFTLVVQLHSSDIGLPPPSVWWVFPLISPIVGEILGTVRGSRLCVASLLEFSLGRILQGSLSIFLGENPKISAVLDWAIIHSAACRTNGTLVHFIWIADMWRCGGYKWGHPLL